MKIIEQKDLLEMKIDEIMDKALKNVEKNIDTKSGEAHFKFVVEGETPKVNTYPKDVKYSVDFHPRSLRTTSIKRSDLGLNDVNIKLYTSSLTFSNDTSGMQELSDYMYNRYGYSKEDYFFSTMAVYGTIARVLINYLKKVPKAVVQGISFTTAHPGLVKPYIILSKEAEKKGDLIWLEPFKYSGQGYAGFDLLRESFFNVIKNKIKSSQE